MNTIEKIQYTLIGFSAHMGQYPQELQELLKEAIALGEAELRREPDAYLCADHHKDIFTHKIKPWFSYKPEGETNIPLFIRGEIK